MEWERERKIRYLWNGKKVLSSLFHYFSLESICSYFYVISSSLSLTHGVNFKILISSILEHTNGTLDSTWRRNQRGRRRRRKRGRKKKKRRKRRRCVCQNGEFLLLKKALVSLSLSLSPCLSPWTFMLSLNYFLT